jgi:hypothetical protein
MRRTGALISAVQDERFDCPLARETANVVSKQYVCNSAARKLRQLNLILIKY